MLFFFHVIFLSVPNAIYTIKQGGGLVVCFCLVGWFGWVFLQVCVELFSVTFNDHSGSQFQWPPLAKQEIGILKPQASSPLC